MLGRYFLGFHEAVSDAIVMSTFSLKHLHKIGLYNNSTDSYENNINFLMTVALQKVAYMPFAYIVDQVLIKFYSIVVPSRDKFM